MDIFLHGSKVSPLSAGSRVARAVWQAAGMGTPVVLYEMKPQRFSPARFPPLGELVCSNSLRSNSPANAGVC